jgi:hypothetical protein
MTATTIYPLATATTTDPVDSPIPDLDADPLTVERITAKRIIAELTHTAAASQAVITAAASMAGCDEHLRGENLTYLREILAAAPSSLLRHQESIAAEKAVAATRAEALLGVENALSSIQSNQAITAKPGDHAITKTVNEMIAQVLTAVRVEFAPEIARATAA